MLGAWAIDSLNYDDTDLAAHCDGSGPCADVLTFNADNTAITQLSNRSATWVIDAAGHVAVTLVDTGTQITLRRLVKGAETSTALVSFETADKFVNELRMLVK